MMPRLDDRRQSTPPPVDEYDGDDDWGEFRRDLEKRILTYQPMWGLSGIVSRLQHGAASAAEEGDQAAAKALQDAYGRLHALLQHFEQENEPSSPFGRLPDVKEIADNVVDQGIASLDLLSLVALVAASDRDLGELAERIDQRLPPAWLDAMERIGREMLDDHERASTPTLSSQPSGAEPLKSRIAKKVLRELRNP